MFFGFPQGGKVWKRKPNKHGPISHQNSRHQILPPTGPLGPRPPRRAEVAPQTRGVGLRLFWVHFDWLLKGKQPLWRQIQRVIFHLTLQGAVQFPFASAFTARRFPKESTPDMVCFWIPLKKHIQERPRPAKRARSKALMALACKNAERPSHRTSLLSANTDTRAHDMKKQMRTGFVSNWRTP